MTNNNSKNKLIELLKNSEINKFRIHNNNERLDLTKISLINKKLSKINFSNIDFSGSDFSGSEFINVDFSNCDLTCVKFSKSYIKKSNFSGSILMETKFDKSKILKCSFQDADFCGADLSDANLLGSDFKFAENLVETIYNDSTIWPNKVSLYYAKNSNINDLKKWLKKKNLQKRIKKLSFKYKDKKILIYGGGLLAQAILEDYNLNNLNVVGVADQKFNEDQQDFYGHKRISRNNITIAEPDVILIATQNVFRIKKYLRNEIFFDNKPIIESFVKRNIKEIFNEWLDRY